MMQRARLACAAIAAGPFTPVVFERYEFIGGERGWLLGYPSETVNGQGCIVWSCTSRWSASAFTPAQEVAA
jgi:hypothetical protein